MAGAEPGATAGGCQLSVIQQPQKLFLQVGPGSLATTLASGATSMVTPTMTRCCPAGGQPPVMLTLATQDSWPWLVATLGQAGLGCGNGWAEDRQQASSQSPRTDKMKQAASSKHMGFLVQVRKPRHRGLVFAPFPTIENGKMGTGTQAA